MMKILAIEKELPGAAAEDFQLHSRAEAAKAWELYQSDVIREMYFREDQNTAVLMLECADIKEAKKELNKMPYVKEGLIIFDLIPLVPYPGFSRLFAAAE